jgi:hypothetical protein
MCGLSKDLNEFGTYSDNGIQRKRARCNPCRSKVQKERYKKNPDVHREYLLRAKYGLTLEQYDTMLARQEGRCAICGTTNPASHHKRFVVDHNHATNEVRGLLCSMCNTGLGNFFDNPFSLLNAAKYLFTLGYYGKQTESQ